MWRRHIRKASSYHIRKSVCDGTAVFVDLLHVGIDLLSWNGVLKGYLCLLVGFIVEMEQIYNIFWGHRV
jgi:hypothetical protein